MGSPVQLWLFVDHFPLFQRFLLLMDHDDKTYESAVKNTLIKLVCTDTNTADEREREHAEINCQDESKSKTHFLLLFPFSCGIFQ